VLSASTRIKTKPQGVELFQGDDTEIGTRKPLLLINGLHSEYFKQLHWTRLMKHLSQDSQFNKTYKIYFARYDSEAPFTETVPAFKKAIVDLHGWTGGQQTTILALSIGGNVVHCAVCDKQVSSMVERVLTLGTPFHGSPLFAEDWIQYSLYKNPSILLSRYVDSLTVHAYLYKNRVLAKFLGWDNFDRLMPDSGQFSSIIPFGPKGVLTADADTNTSLYRLNASDDLDKTKFVTYAAYLPNPFTSRQHFVPRMASHLFTSQLFYTVVLPKPRPFLKLFNWELSRVICKRDQAAGMRHCYAMNDGVAPVTSALFLPSNALNKSSTVADESSIEQLSRQIDVGKARLFRGIDHLTFVDGSRPLFSPKLLKDQLNPAESSRAIFDWIRFDLMNGTKPRNAQATSLSGAS
jgi:hypothetical protein